MPYSKDHKAQTRRKILQSSYLLFTARGYEKITINELMNHCHLTRGAFYAHFSSKAELYSETLKFAATSSKLAKIKPESYTDKQWLKQLLDVYLSIEHINGTRTCPLAFLAADISTQDINAQRTYSKAYDNMNKTLLAYANSYMDCSEYEILSITAMIIGAVAIARTMQDESTAQKLLASCRKEAGLRLGNI